MREYLCMLFIKKNLYSIFLQAVRTPQLCTMDIMLILLYTEGILIMGQIQSLIHTMRREADIILKAGQLADMGQVRLAQPYRLVHRLVRIMQYGVGRSR